MIGLAFVAFLFSDIAIHTSQPWFELSLMLKGFAQPVFMSWHTLWPALCKTLSFAIQGVVCSALLGFILALFFNYTWIRLLASFSRAIHELFWALLFIQIAGLSPLTGFLAILIPYTGVFAKVFSEILDECDKEPERSLSLNPPNLSLFLYTRFFMCWEQLKNYLSYRLECGLRSSAILGFVGLPTLGFELESFFKQGDYAEAAGLLYLFFILIISLKYVFKVTLLPFYVVAAFLYLPPVASGSWTLMWGFITHDIVPAPLRTGDWLGFLDWCKTLCLNSAFKGVFNSLILAQIALVCTGVMSLTLFPFRSALFFSKPWRFISHSGLIVLRSCPEYLLTFISLLIFGPSMLPAIIALSVHNSSIIAHLLALQSAQLKLQIDVQVGFNRYFYEVLPRLYGNFLALLFYRWEIILRETAILGMLGIPTLGFFIDSAFEDIRFDRALFFILISAILNMTVDSISVFFRKRLHIHSQPELV